MKYFYINTFILLLFIPNLVLAMQYPEQKVTQINQVQLTLEESLADLSKAYGIDIELKGSPEAIPQRKFSLNIKQVTIEQAINKVLKSSNVQNYAVFLNQEKKNVEVWILGAYNKEIFLSEARPKIIHQGKMKPLTQDQMNLLAQNDQGLNKEECHPLTPEQIDLLLNKSYDIESKMVESKKALTKQQLEQLKVKSANIEVEMEKGKKPLTEKQLDLLQGKSEEIEKESRINKKPLSKEQMILLKEQNN